MHPGGEEIICQYVPPRRPSWPEPAKIPEEDRRVIRLPSSSQVCEPLSISVVDLARIVQPLLPPRLQSRYTATPDGFKFLADELGRFHNQGGLNSPEQRSDGKVDRETITRAEAYRFIAGYHTFIGNGMYDVRRTDLAQALVTFTPREQQRPILESIFFSLAPLDGARRRRDRISKLVKAEITGISDGDTIKVVVKRPDCADEEHSIRFSGIDTPEKFRSAAKFWPQVRAVLDMWLGEGLLVSKGETVRDHPIETLLANRMEYAGAISSLLMMDFILWAGERKASFYLEETYSRTQNPGDSPEVCDMVAMYGNYLRGIWVVRVEPPRLLQEYVDTRLAEAMSSGGRQWWERPGAKRMSAGYRRQPDRPDMALWQGHLESSKRMGHDIVTNGDMLWEEHQLDWLAKNGSINSRRKHAEAKRALEQLRRDGRSQLADLLDPAKFPKPRELYSPKNVEKISEEYRQSLRRHPDREGDLNFAMVATGAAYVYTKYRNELAGIYLEISDRVKAARLGLWGEETMVMLDVNERKVDKERGVFVPFTIPPDCLTRR